MQIPARHSRTLKQKNGSSALVCPRESCSVGCGQFCEDAWNGIALRLDLSPRQIEVCRGVIVGQRDKEIAISLGMSSRTVQTHMGRLYEKLGIQNRAELATRVFAAYHAWRNELHPPTVCP